MEHVSAIVQFVNNNAGRKIIDVARECPFFQKLTTYLFLAFNFIRNHQLDLPDVNQTFIYSSCFLMSFLCGPLAVIFVLCIALFGCSIGRDMSKKYFENDIKYYPLIQITVPCILTFLFAHVFYGFFTTVLLTGHGIYLSIKLGNDVRQKRE